MTGAAPATDDLEFFIPGNGYLEHGGKWQKWPVDDKGRDLSMYKNNNFGPSKSYHIVGDYKNYFGGYYHDSNVGFGHLSPYEEMPGQKLWLWALSRSGGIWEDLLTDTDGQYIEFQAGRLFNQYFPGEENPVSQANFDPYVMDTWQELWFPIKQIGGMEAASAYGVLNVEHNEGETTLGINALQAFSESLEIFLNGEKISTEELQMVPMQVFEKTFPSKDADTLEVFLGKDKLQYTSVNKTLLKRDFVHKPEVQMSNVEKLYHEASEAMKYREYDLADEKLSQLLSLDATHPRALILLAEAEYRKTRYNKTLEHANTVLQLDTYNPGANYMAGIAYWAQNDALNALEHLGWAARSIQYRSVAYAQMAEVHLHEDNTKKAREYAKKALAFNKYNVNARQVLLVAFRKTNDMEAFSKQLDKLGQISPISHFATLEKILAEGGEPKALLAQIQNEFAEESILELALEYLNLGQDQTAIELLDLNASDNKSKLLLAYTLDKKNADKSSILIKELASGSPNFVFPYRREMIPALEWAVSRNDDWKFKYYLAQNYMAIGLNDKAKTLLEQCGDLPKNDAFYKFRAKTLDDASYENKLKDYSRAFELNANYWKNWDDLMLFYLENDKNKEAASLGKKSVKRFPNNYNVGLSYTKALVATGDYSRAITVLGGLNILPFEHASESKNIYNNAHIYLAKQHINKNQFDKAVDLLEDSKLWPENLGVGTPYNPDDRLPNYLLAVCKEKSGNQDEAKSYFGQAVNHEGGSLTSTNTIFKLLALEKLGQDIEKEKLLSKLKKVSEDNSDAELILALYAKDSSKAESIAASKKIDSRLMDILKYTLNQ